MPIQDRVAAARRVDEVLRNTIQQAGFRLKYRISANPPVNTELGESPEIVVEFAGPDSPLLLERNGELLRALEHVSLKVLRLESEEHDKLSFDCMNFKTLRAQELKLAAEVAAERVRKTGQPYQFAPMSARERRMVHLAMREEPSGGPRVPRCQASTRARSSPPLRGTQESKGNETDKGAKRPEKEFSSVSIPRRRRRHSRR